MENITALSPAPTTDTSNPSPAAPGNPAALTTPPGTALQIAQMLAAGSIDTKQAGRLAKAGNLSTLDVAHALTTLREAGEPQKLDQRSPEVKQLDAAFPPAKESDFTIRYGLPGVDMQMTPERQQADTAFRTWMGPRGMGLPRENGNALVHAVMKTVQETQHMTPAQLDEFGEREMTRLRSLYGDQLETKLNNTATMLRALEQTQPGVMNLLRSKGIGDAARVVTQLVNHYEIWAARQR